MILNEGVCVQEAKACIFCNKKGLTLYQNLRDRLFSAPGIWSILYCLSCDLAWLDPQPVVDDIEKLYAEYYTHQINDNLNANKKLAKLRKAIKANILKNVFGYHIEEDINYLSKLLSRLRPLREKVGRSIRWLEAKEKGVLLDVGCGNGQFLAYMRELGWQVVGVEPDPKAVNTAREHFNLEVYNGTLEEVKFPENSFDAITINHVIEHVHDPVGLLSESFRILRSGGKIVVITPNIKSLGQYIFKENWRGWEPPRHLFLFSPKSLKMCAEKAGITLEKIFTSSRNAKDMWIKSFLIYHKKKIKSYIDIHQKANPLLFGGFVFWGIEYLLNKLKPLGEEIVFIGTK